MEQRIHKGGGQRPVSLAVLKAFTSYHKLCVTQASIQWSTAV